MGEAQGAFRRSRTRNQTTLGSREHQSCLIGKHNLRRQGDEEVLQMRSMTTMFFSLLLVACVAAAQSWTPPAENQRCPSKWSAGDERGSGNLMKPEQVLKAAKLIRTGEVIELGQVLDPEKMPFFPGRQLSIMTKRTNVLPQSNRRISNEEMVIGEMGQIGTQFDGFSHQGIDNGFYNCFKQDQIATRNGFSKLGIEKVGALMTRGVLIDVAALKGVEMLPDMYEITVRDLQDALKRQNLTLQAGDAIIINTGWGKFGARIISVISKQTPASASQLPNGW